MKSIKNYLFRILTPCCKFSDFSMDFNAFSTENNDFFCSQNAASGSDDDLVNKTANRSS